MTVQSLVRGILNVLRRVDVPEPERRSSIAMFQRTHGLVPDGAVGPVTVEKIDDMQECARRRYMEANSTMEVIAEKALKRLEKARRANGAAR